MEILLFIIAGLFMILGLLGSFLPVLPGVPLSWVGLLLLFLIPGIPISYWFLGITLFIAIVIYLLNLFIPAAGTKKYGGSKGGMIGASLGLVVGIIAPVPFGIFIGTFTGAFIGEILSSKNSRVALKAAYGSFIGLLASSFMEFMVALCFLVLFAYKVWEFREVIF